MLARTAYPQEEKPKKVRVDFFGEGIAEDGFLAGQLKLKNT